jgi:hypothetical protein
MSQAHRADGLEWLINSIQRTIFWDITPCSLAWLILRSWRWRRCSSETLFDFQRSTRCYNHCCENLKS